MASTSPTNAPAPDHLLSSFTDMWETVRRPGDGKLKGLATNSPVVVWDAPGTGGSSDPPESFGITGYADCLAGFVEKLGLDRPSVAGLSFGGILALEFCHRHPTCRGL